MKKMPKKEFFFIIITVILIGFMSGVVGELWLNSFLLPDPYINFKTYEDLSKKIDDLISTDSNKRSLSEKDRTIEEPINKVLPTVVSIYKDKDFSEKTVTTLESSDLLGQGVIITNDGWILSSSEVVTNLKADYWIVTNDRQVYEVKEIIDDSKTGVVYLKIEANNLPVIEFALKNSLISGQSTLVFSEDQRVSSNQIIDLDYFMAESIADYVHNSEDFYKRILLRQEVSSLGSPVVNLDGKMIGVVIEKQGLVLPIDYLLPFMKNLNNQEDWFYPNLGINYFDLSEIINPLIDQKKGIMILKSGGFDKNSPALNIFKAEDVILKVENDELNSRRSLAELLIQFQTEQTINFTVKRGEEELILEVKLGKLEK